MKIRSSFVSNSSSSSFAVAVGSEYKDECIFNLQIDLSKYASHTITTVEELDAFFDKRYVKPFVTWEQQRYDAMLAQIQKGKVILYGILSSENCDAVEQAVRQVGLDKMFSVRFPAVVLEGGDGGY